MNYVGSLFDESVTLRKVATGTGRYGGDRDDNKDGDDTSGGSEGYSQVLNEVEKINQALSRTQALLLETEEENLILRGAVEDSRGEDEFLRDEIERLNQEILDRDEGRSRPELEKRLRKAVEFLKKDLSKLTEKYQEAEGQIERQKQMIAELKVAKIATEAAANEQENRYLSTGNELFNCKERLQEATNENASLLEEVASLREELDRIQNMANKKDILIRQEVEEKVKEKIKFETREAITQQITERVTRDVTIQVKAQCEKEIRALRDQLKKIIKENADLQARIEVAESLVSESIPLQNQVESLTFELERYENMIDEARQDHEMHLTRLETDYRIQMQAIREEAAREKWTNASEIRKQMLVEREREAEKFAERVDSLSKQTDQLLAQAAKEKEQHANEIKRKVQQSMEDDIKELKNRLDAQRHEMEEMRMSFDEKARKEIVKHSNLVENLMKENKYLQEKLARTEEETEQVWDESEQLEEELKKAKGEILTMRRKLENLVILNKRYKHDAQEANRALQETKDVFRQAYSKARVKMQQLDEKLMQRQPKREKKMTTTIKALEDTKKSLVLRVNLYEEENKRLKSENAALRETGNVAVQNISSTTTANDNGDRRRKVYIQEISHLKKQMKDLISSNEGYVNQIQHLETAMKSLEADAAVIRSDNERIVGMLEKSKDEKSRTLRQLGEIKKKSVAALQKSENEKYELQKALNEAKKMALGSQSILGHVENEIYETARPVLQPSTNLTLMNEGWESSTQPYQNDNEDEDEDHLFSRLDTLLGLTKDWDSFLKQSGEQEAAMGISDEAKRRNTNDDPEKPEGQGGDAKIDVLPDSSGGPKTRFSFYPQPEDRAPREAGSPERIQKCVSWDIPEVNQTSDIVQMVQADEESRNPSVEDMTDALIFSDVASKREDIASSIGYNESSILKESRESQCAPGSAEENPLKSRVDTSGTFVRAAVIDDAINGENSGNDTTSTAAEVIGNELEDEPPKAGNGVSSANLQETDKEQETGVLDNNEETQDQGNSSIVPSDGQQGRRKGELFRFSRRNRRRWVGESEKNVRDENKDHYTAVVQTGAKEGISQKIEDEDEGSTAGHILGGEDTVIAATTTSE